MRHSRSPEQVVARSWAKTFRTLARAVTRGDINSRRFGLEALQWFVAHQPPSPVTPAACRYCAAPVPDRDPVSDDLVIGACWSQAGELVLVTSGAQLATRCLGCGTYSTDYATLSEARIQANIHAGDCYTLAVGAAQ